MRDSISANASRIPALIFIAVLCAATVFRIFIGLHTPIWAVSAANQDDFLLFLEGDLRHHFNNHYNLSLVKPMSFSVMLQIIHWLHIPYRVVICVLWILGAGLTAGFCRLITKNKIFIALAYGFVLFCPVAFDEQLGGRVYRNAILAPAVFIVIALALLLSYGVIFRKFGARTGVVLGILLGLAFSFFYYIKEDSIWLLPLFLVCVIVCGVAAAVRIRKGERKARKWIVIAVVPLLVFLLGMNAYKAVNYHYFGVYEINTRTESAFADFTARLYKIEDPAKSMSLWLPFSTFEKVWAVSPALAQHPEVLEELRHSPWASGDLVATPLPGDFPVWAFRDALGANALYIDEKTVLDLLSAANEEIDAAFADGRLTQMDKIYLSGATIGRTPAEIAALAPLVCDEVSMTAFYSDYFVQSTPHVNEGSGEIVGRAAWMEEFMRDSFSTAESMRTPAAAAAANAGAAAIRIYRVTSFVLVPLSIIGFVGLLVLAVRRKDKQALYGFVSMGMLLLSALALLAAVAWFSEWLDASFLNVYSVGAVPAIQLFELLGVYAVARKIKSCYNK